MGYSIELNARNIETLANVLKEQKIRIEEQDKVITQLRQEIANIKQELTNIIPQVNMLRAGVGMNTFRGATKV